MQLTRIGPYRLEEQIGAGGMGVVYRAYDERLDRWVAVKFIQPGKHEDAVGRERLRREARASARLSHPAIVQIYDMVQTEEGDGIVMELVEGKTLAQILRDGPFDLKQGLALAREIASALVEAHRHGVIHRDLKSENVIVTAQGRAKILDFGLAKRVEQATQEEAALTVDGMVLGTCRSMAPEQIEGRLIDPRTDLFSFGTLLYETFTGVSPFFDKSVIETLKRVCLLRQPPARETNPRLPEELSGLIDHLLQKDPALRPQNAQAVLSALERMSGMPQDQPSSSAAGFKLPSGLLPSTGIGSAGSSGSEGSATSLQSAYSASVDGPPTTMATRRSSGERRQVTVVRCGLVGRGGHSLDPEETLDWMPRLQALVSETVQRFEGHLEPALGGELHACFGYPQAHEDDARRAVHTAMEVVARSLPGGGPGVRAGIHTGTVVVARAAGAYREELALGDLPNLAGVVQGLGGPGQVLVSGSTHRLVERFFVCEALEPLRHSGTAQPVRVYRVLQERDLQSQEEGSGAALLPLVARSQELNLMLERWAMAREGKGQVVLLGGEAGIGKSRLVRELKHQIAADRPEWLELHGSPYHRNSVLYPVVDLMRRWMDLGRTSGDQNPLSRVEHALRRYGFPLAETVPIFAGLLSIPLGDRYEPLNLSPEGQRKRTLEAVLAVVLEMAERRPLVIAVDDLQWVDPSTLELLGHILQQGAAARIFTLMTFRPDFEPPWGQRSYITQLNLGPLSSRQIEQMIERLAGGRTLPPAVVAQINEKADGVPLVIEEMVKMVLESGQAEGSGPVRPLEIPATLRDSLMARLDRLGSAKEVAQLAATLGREFSHDLLVAVSPWDEDHLQRELTRLVDAELLYRRGLPPRARYLFKHGLIQDAAYESLLRSHRQEFHGRIAEVLERRFPEIADSQPELVAHHATEAGRLVDAIGWWHRAGQKALRGLGPPGGRRPPHPRAGAAGVAAGERGARPAGDRAARLARRGGRLGHELLGARRAALVRTRAGPLPRRGADAAALPGVARPLHLLRPHRQAAHGPRDGAAAPPPGRGRREPGPPGEQPPGHGLHRDGAGGPPAGPGLPRIGDRVLRPRARPVGADPRRSAAGRGEPGQPRLGALVPGPSRPGAGAQPADAGRGPRAGPAVLARLRAVLRGRAAGLPARARRGAGAQRRADGPVDPAGLSVLAHHGHGPARLAAYPGREGRGGDRGHPRRFEVRRAAARSAHLRLPRRGLPQPGPDRRGAGRSRGVRGHGGRRPDPLPGGAAPPAR